MRPTARGIKLTADNVIDECWAIGGTHVLQPKLNGDRAGLAVIEGNRVVIQSRRGDWYPFEVQNRNTFAKSCSPGTLFDGEVYRKVFYPFELLAINGESLLREPVEARIYSAREVCETIGVPWLFSPPCSEWLKAQATAIEPPLTRQWEGVVAKMKGTPYKILGAAHQESPEWTKLKWC